MKKRVLDLIRRGHELAEAEYRYKPLIYHLRDLFTKMSGSEFAAKVDRRVLTRLEGVLDREIRPQILAVREEYVGLFGCAWADWVRIENPGMPTVELVPTDMYFNPWKADPHARLHGRALKANGRPGSKGVQTRLAFGSSKVTVMSAAAGRT